MFGFLGDREGEKQTDTYQSSLLFVARFRCSGPQNYLHSLVKKRKKILQSSRQVSRSAALLPALISWAGTKMLHEPVNWNRALSSSFFHLDTHTKAKANTQPPISLFFYSLFSRKKKKKKILWCLLLLLLYANKLASYSFLKVRKGNFGVNF
jgi:hypothetical protein